MSQKAKKRKLDAMEGVQEYIDKVNSGEIEGEYGKNLIAGNEDFKELHDKDKFEIRPLLYKGYEIGIAKCSHSNCEAKGKLNAKCTFAINDNRKAGYKPQLIIRHCERNHKSAKEKAAASRLAKSKSNQPTLDQFLPKKKLDKETIQGMRQRNKQVIAYNNTAIGFFGKQSVKDRDRYLLEQLGYDGDEVNKFDVGAESVKSDSRKTAARNRTFIKQVADKCAKTGAFGLTLDHKSTNNQTAEEEKWCIGVGLIFTDVDEQLDREHYLLHYGPVKDQKVETNLPIVQEVLEMYGLDKAVEQGTVFFVGDQKCQALAKAVGPKCLYEICNFHNLGNLISGTNRHFPNWDGKESAKKKRDNLKQFISKSRKDWSLKELKNFHPNTARSVNSWINSHELSEDDKLRVAKYSKPSGWLEKFEDDSEALSPTESARKNKILSKITKLPKLKELFDIRPRTIEPNLIAILCLEPHYQKAKEDFEHPLYAHVEKMPIDFNYVAAQYAVINRIGSLMNYFEGTHNFQSGEYTTAMLHLVKWISETESRNSRISIELSNHKRALMASISEQLIRCYISADKKKIVNKNVPWRMSPMSLIANRLYFLNSNAQARNIDENMRFREMRLYLAGSKDEIIQKYADAFKEETKSYATLADEEIVKLGEILELDAVIPEEHPTENLLADDEEDDSDDPTNMESVRSALYDVNNSSLATELKNYNSQSFAHFNDCKYL